MARQELLQMKMDAIDLKILAELQNDGKLSNVELADRVGLSPSPCLTRVRSLEDTGCPSSKILEQLSALSNGESGSSLV